MRPDCREGAMVVGARDRGGNLLRCGRCRDRIPPENPVGWSFLTGGFFHPLNVCASRECPCPWRTQARCSAVLSLPVLCFSSKPSERLLMRIVSRLVSEIASELGKPRV